MLLLPEVRRRIEEIKAELANPDSVEVEAWAAVLHSEDRAQALADIEQTVQNGKVYDTEFRIRVECRNHFLNRIFQYQSVRVQEQKLLAT